MKMSTTRANRPIRDKTHKSSDNSTSDSQSSAVKKQPTAEQMRIAQMTENSKGEDPEVKAKIHQVIELTGRTENDALFALYDVNYDLNRAVEKLLESSEADTQQNEWHKISKKKKSQPVAKVEPVVNNKLDNKREKSKDRDFEKPDGGAPRSSSNSNRRDRGPPRFQRGRGKDRISEDDRNNRIENSSGERNADRGERGARGRGRGGGPGRGRGRGGPGGSRNFRGTRFDNNSSKERGPQIDTWTNDQAETAEKENIGSWGDMAEDWTADEWQGSLDDSKVFTASSAPDSNMFSATVNDNDAKMFTPPPSIETKVFTATSLANSSVSPTLNDTTNTFQHGGSLLQQNAMSQGSLGRGGLGQNSLTQNSLGPSTLGPRLDIGTLFPKVAEAQNAMNQQQSQFMSQFAKEATESIKNAVGIGSSAAGQQNPVGMPQSSDANRSMAPPSGHSSNQQSVAQSQNRSKSQRTKLPPPSKIPASAVEMPGGVSFQLDVQFGNWDYPSSGGDSNTGLGFGSSISSAGTVSNSYVTPPVSAPTKPQSSTGISSLDGLSQSNSQSPRGSRGVFQNSTSSTPPKDFSQSSLGQTAAMTTPEPIPYPSSERKASPYGAQRSGQSSGSVSSNKPATSPMTFSQPSYSSSSYQSSAYKPSLTSASTYSHSTNGLASGSLSHQSGLQSQNQYSSSGGYQSSSFQNQTGFSSNQGQNSLYQGSSNQSNSYSSQSGGPTSYTSGNVSGSSYQNQTNSYPSQSGSSYPSQSYSSRDSSHSSQSGSSAYQPSGVSQSGSSYQTSVTQSSAPASSTAYQRDSQSAGQSSYSHQSYGAQNSHQNSLPSSSTKLSDSIGKMTINDSALDSQPSQFDHSSTISSVSLTTSTSTTSSSLASAGVSVSTSMGLSGTATSSYSSNAMSKSALPVTTKAPPNLPPGVPIIPNYMTIGQPGMAPFAFAGLAAQQHMYGYEDVQLLQQRIPMQGYSYDMPLQPASTMAAGRDQTATLGSVHYSSAAGSDAKLARVDAQSPVNSQTTQQQQSQSAHQQTFINPTALPPGYNYYYPSGVLPGGYSYPPTMFPVPSVTNAAHGGSTASVQFQKPAAYGSHAYGTAGQSQDFTKAYSGASTAQNKVSSGSLVGGTTSTDLTGTGINYGKTHTQSLDKAAFHAGTPPPFNLQLPSGTQAGPMGAPSAYGTPYMPVMTHQPHSQLLHHQLQQDSAATSARSSQQAVSQNKAAVGKISSTYWGGN